MNAPIDTGMVLRSMAQTIEQLSLRVRDLEKRTVEKGGRGEKGEPGERGEKGDAGERGERGEKGEPGAKGEKGEPGERGEKGDAGERGERGEKGDRGEKGLQGDRGPEGGRGQQGEPGLPGRDGRDGKDGEKGADGKDGLGFDDLSVEFDGERTVTLKFQRGEDVRKFPIRLPVIVDRGVWTERTYEKGDGVTWGGSYWIAQTDTKAKPETNADWRLAVRRGRDGKHGKDGERGMQGPKGDRGEPGPRGYGG